MGTLMKWLASRPAADETGPREPRCIEDLRQRSLEAIADCTRPNDERLRLQLQRALTAQQLWLARSDLYQAIARQHCEAEAVRRINALVPAFEGWLPPGALTML
jgi:hypothetical protein